jgi:hypothetical protein
MQGTHPEVSFALFGDTGDDLAVRRQRHGDMLESAMAKALDAIDGRREPGVTLADLEGGRRERAAGSLGRRGGRERSGSRGGSWSRAGGELLLLGSGGIFELTEVSFLQRSILESQRDLRRPTRLRLDDVDHYSRFA